MTPDVQARKGEATPASANRQGIRFLRRKSVASIQAESDKGELKRSLGPFNLLFMGIGCIIGAGIFVRTGSAAALHAGPAVLISFVLAGLVSALAGLCYAEIASTLPVSGSAYTYSYATLGEFAAWTMGALLVLEYGLSAAVVAVGWSGYVVSLLTDYAILIPVELTGPFGHAILQNGAPVLGVDGAPLTTLFNLPAFGICIVITTLLVFGVSESAKVNNVIVLVKVGVIVAFVLVAGFFVLRHLPTLSANWSPFIPPATGVQGEFGWSGVVRATSIVFFAYIGFEAVSTAGQETVNPAKAMPIGIIGSLLICTLLYILVATVMTLIVNYHHLDVPDPVAVAVDALGPQWQWFARIVKAGAILGLTSNVLVLLYGQTRIFYAMAHDGLLPRVFARVHPRLRTPWINTMVVGVSTALAAGLFDINTLGDMTSVGTLAAFAIVCVTVIWLRSAYPHLPRGFSVPFPRVIPVLGVVACTALIFAIEARILIFFATYLVCAVALYFAYGFRHSRLARAEA